MRLIFTLWGVFVASAPLFSQSWNLQNVAALPNLVAESSGLTFFQGRLVTHNDSGNPPFLFEIDTNNAAVSRSIWIGALNTDWEDIASDSQYLFLADIGNNLGNRTDLKILRITATDFLNATDSVHNPETIAFNYPEQTTFPGAPFQTAFDGEALFAYHNSLYILTKNWTGLHSLLYQVPKSPGQHAAVLLDSLPVSGLVTAAAADSSGNALYITINTPLNARLMIVSNLQEWLNGQAPITTTYTLPTTGSIQVEAVAINGGQSYFTAETGSFGQGHLYKSTSALSIPNWPNFEVMIFPNPSRGHFKVTIPTHTHWQLFDGSGQLVQRGHHKNASELDLNLSIPGVYHFTCTLGQGHFHQKLIVMP